jgi:hypothetical protein
MYLGLDLRGGVHFMLQVDMRTALTKNLDTQVATCAPRCATRTCATAASRAKARPSRSAPPGPGRAGRRAPPDADQFPDLQVDPAATATDGRLVRPQARGPAPVQDRRSSRTSPRCTTGQRTGRGRAGDPAAGPGPHRGAAARRAGHGQGQGHPGPHRHAGNAHGGRQRRGRAAALGRGRCPSATSYLERNGTPLIVKRRSS